MQKQEQHLPDHDHEIECHDKSAAHIIITNFLPEENTRNVVFEFLANAIIYANKIASDNWNLNLDKNGEFLRFNTGQEYCIEISDQKLFVLCLKSLIKDKMEKDICTIKYQGYNKKQKIISKNINDVPDCLRNVKDSVGCILKSTEINEYLPHLISINNKFIDIAIRKTTIRPKMKRAHSERSIEYLSQATNKIIPNPTYINTLKEPGNLDESSTGIKYLPDEELIDRLNLRKETKINRYTTTQYSRNPDLAKYVKEKASWICQDCKQKAPFIDKATNQPYLEIHHIKPLSEDGSDTLENVIALCPNCHRKRHHG